MYNYYRRSNKSGIANILLKVEEAFNTIAPPHPSISQNIDDSILFTSDNVFNKCQRKPNGQSKIGNSEKLATQDTQEEEKQNINTHAWCSRIYNNDVCPAMCEGQYFFLMRTTLAWSRYFLRKRSFGLLNLVISVTLFRSACIKLGKLAVMYMCYRRIDVTFVEGFYFVLTLWYLFFFNLFFIRGIHVLFCLLFVNVNDFVYLTQRCTLHVL